MCRDYFLIPITLAPREDRPAERTLWFLYDTGASEAFVDPLSIERISGMKVKTGQRDGAELEIDLFLFPLVR